MHRHHYGRTALVAAMLATAVAPTGQVMDRPETIVDCMRSEFNDRRDGKGRAPRTRSNAAAIKRAAAKRHNVEKRVGR